MGLDKFSSAEALENSYKELEKEFTKKCQELAKVRNELGSLKSMDTESVAEENISQPSLEEVVVEEPKVEEVAETPQSPIETNSSQFRKFFPRVDEVYIIPRWIVYFCIVLEYTCSI